MADRVDYRILQPPGWVHLRITDDPTNELRRFARYVASASPAEVRPGLERLIRDEMTTAFAQARETGGQDMYLPTQLVDGLAMPMSIVVASSDAPRSPDETASGALLAFAARNDGSQARSVGGRLAVRVVTATPPQPGSDDPTRLLGSRRITYLVDAPGARLVIVTCSILQYEFDTEDDIVDALEALFDAITASIRWAIVADEQQGEEEAS